MNNLKTNLDSIIVELCQVSSDHDAQLAEKDQRIELLQGWLNIERALRVEATERIKELSEQLGKSRKENREAYEQWEQLREENDHLRNQLISKNWYDQDL